MYTENMEKPEKYVMLISQNFDVINMVILC